MKILVCVKQVPDTSEIKLDPKTHTMIRAGVPSIVNPYDSYALEMALRLKESWGEGEVTVLSMGPQQAEKALRECLSMGAANACLVSDKAFGGSDTLATSYILAAAVNALEKQHGPFDLILCGKQAIDGDTGQVGPELAEALSLPQITYICEARAEGDVFWAKRESDEGYDWISCAFPLLATVVKPAYEPRSPSLKNKIAANKAEIPVLGAAALGLDLARCGLKGSPTQVRETFAPQRKKRNVIIHESSGALSAKALVGMLWNAQLLRGGKDDTK